MLGINDAAIFIIQTLGSLYLLIVLMRFILQLVRANFYNPLCQFVVKATQPLLKPLRRSLDAWLSEMLPVSAFGSSSVYSWVAADGPARLLTSD